MKTAIRLAVALLAFVSIVGVTVDEATADEPAMTVSRQVAVSERAQRKTLPERQTPPDRSATIISDSAMAGIRWNGALGGFRGFNADDRLESCRRGRR